MWSMTFISNRVAAFVIFVVVSISAGLGLSVPEGWLWAKIIFVASRFRARRIINFVSVIVLSIEPWHIIEVSRTRFELFRYTTQNSSWIFVPRIG